VFPATKGRTKNVTVFTDASFCSDTGAAGGAYWARDDVNKTQRGFPLHGVLKSHQAELLAAVTAIEDIVVKINTPIDLSEPGRILVILVTDCLAVQHCFKVRAEGESPELRARVVSIWDAITANGMGLKINHVKAHTKDSSSRSWVNRWCDREAYTHMTRMRAHIKDKE